MRTLRIARTILVGCAAAALLTSLAPTAQAAPAPAADGAQTPPASADPDTLPYDAATTVGVHNAYEQTAFPYLADALDSGAGMLEIDVWTNFFGSGFRVAHDTPFGNANNCVGATDPADLRAGDRDQNLAGCLTDLRTWHDAHPDHRPIHLKLEMKDGFAANLGRGPAELDALVDDTLGDAVFGPADLTGSHATVDDAVTADGWPERGELRGRFVIHLIPGTVEERNPFDQLWTDEEYATHLRDLAAAGDLGQATAFPAVHHAAPGDPRVERYDDPSLRPWFVVFDGAAPHYVESRIDTSWYAERGYLLVMTAAHEVAPPIDARRPEEAEARERAAELAGRHASVVSSDWTELRDVLATVLPRG